MIRSTKMCWGTLRWLGNTTKRYYDFSNRLCNRNCKTTHHLVQRDISFGLRVLYNNDNRGGGGINEKVHHSFLNRNTSGLNEKFISTCCVLRKNGDRGVKKKITKSLRVDLNESAEILDMEKFIAQMDHAVEELKGNFIKHLTLRSSAGSIEQVVVNFEGEEYILQELVQIVHRPNMVVLNAISFPQAIPEILKALNSSGMNLNPQQDGTTLFIPIPKITKEHREGLAKNAKALYIKSRDAMKAIKNRQVKSLKSIPSLSDDKIRRIHAQLEGLCDEYVKRAESIFQAKHKELLKSSE